MFFLPIEVQGELDHLSFHNLCVHMHVNKTKFERNRSLAIEYYQLTCIGKKIQAKEVYWFYEQNNSSARVSRFFLTFL